MKDFGITLQEERLARGFSLEQVAEATLISRQYLQAIEEGNTDILPQPYIRAFLREYAAVVGLDPEDVLVRYDLARSAGRAEPVPASVRETPVERARSLPALLLESKVGWAALTLFVLAAFVAVIGLLGGNDEPPAEEVPFQDVVREQEQRLGAQVADDALQSRPPRAVKMDSLSLAATINDSLWLQIAIDGGQPLEYIFPPNRRATWVAAERFVLTLGNAGAAEFSLQGTLLGKLGRPGAVARNVEITRELLRKE